MISSGLFHGHAYVVERASPDQVLLRFEIPPGGLQELAVDFSVHPARMWAHLADAEHGVYEVVSPGFRAALGVTNESPEKATLIIRAVESAEPTPGRMAVTVVLVAVGAIGFFSGNYWLMQLTTGLMLALAPGDDPRFSASEAVLEQLRRTREVAPAPQVLGGDAVAGMGTEQQARHHR